MIDYSALPELPPNVDWMTAPDSLYPYHLAWWVEWHRIWWFQSRHRDMSLFGENYADFIGWCEDFLRALNERPRWVRWLLRLLMGRYAYRELIGIRDTCHRHGFNTTFSYSCEGQDYHKDKVKLWDDLP